MYIFLYVSHHLEIISQLIRPTVVRLTYIPHDISISREPHLLTDFLKSLLPLVAIQILGSLSWRLSHVTTASLEVQDFSKDEMIDPRVSYGKVIYPITFGDEIIDEWLLLRSRIHQELQGKD